MCVGLSTSLGLNTKVDFIQIDPGMRKEGRHQRADLRLELTLHVPDLREHQQVTLPRARHRLLLRADGRHPPGSRGGRRGSLEIFPTGLRYAVMLNQQRTVAHIIRRGQP